MSNMLYFRKVVKEKKPQFSRKKKTDTNEITRKTEKIE